MLLKSDVLGSIHGYKIDYKSEPRLANRKEFEEPWEDLRAAKSSKSSPIRRRRLSYASAIILQVYSSILNVVLHDYLPHFSRTVDI